MKKCSKFNQQQSFSYLSSLPLNKSTHTDIIAFPYFQMVTRTKKIFVGGLSAPTTLDDVKSYFEQFGPVSTTLSLLVLTHPINKLPELTALSTQNPSC